MPVFQVLSSDSHTPTGSKSNDADDGPKENNIIKKMMKDGVNKTPNAITALYGYVGTSDFADILRLYKDMNFNEYYEINRTDIKDWKENDKDPFGGTYIFVDADAEVKVVYIQVTKVKAKFLVGIISKTNVRPQRRMREQLVSQPDDYVENIRTNEYTGNTETCPRVDDESVIREISCDDTCRNTDCGTCPGLCDSVIREISCDDTCRNTDCGTCYDTCDHTCPPTCEGNDTCFYTCGVTVCQMSCHTNTCYTNCPPASCGCIMDDTPQSQPKKYSPRSKNIRNRTRSKMRRT